MIGALPTRHIDMIQQDTEGYRLTIQVYATIYEEFELNIGEI